MRIRTAQGREPMHASDLFSQHSFVGRRTTRSITCTPTQILCNGNGPIHFYSMPFRLWLNTALFSFSILMQNQAPDRSQFRRVDLVARPYELNPASLLFDLRRGEFADSPRPHLPEAAEPETQSHFGRRNHAVTNRRSQKVCVSHDQTRGWRSVQR